MRTGTGTIYIGNLVCMSCETSHQRLVHIHQLVFRTARCFRDVRRCSNSSDKNVLWLDDVT